jgi:hypothetical protein
LISFARDHNNSYHFQLTRAALPVTGKNIPTGKGL